MRGIAIIMVFLVHSTILFKVLNIEKLPLDIQNILFNGKYGVALFFIVSAYTLFRSLDLRKEKGFRNYFIRRFFRIAPLYYLIIIIVYIFTDGNKYFLGTSESLDLLNLLTHIFFINGFFTNYFNSIIGVEWTIFVEFSFYFILPIIYIYKKYLLKIFLFLFFISIIITVLGKSINLELMKIQMALSPLVWFFVFGLGLIFYTFESNSRIKYFFVNQKNLLLIFSFFLIFFIKIASVESKICVLIEPPVLFPIVPTVKLL
jgi:peptidoglycan/LPS O-acetylase OafA/YrhL